MEITMSGAPSQEVSHSVYQDQYRKEEYTAVLGDGDEDVDMASASRENLALVPDYENVDITVTAVNQRLIFVIEETLEFGVEVGYDEDIFEVVRVAIGEVLSSAEISNGVDFGMDDIAQNIPFLTETEDELVDRMIFERGTILQ